MKTTTWISLLAAVFFAFLVLGCDKAEDAEDELVNDDGTICLDELLEYVGMTREDLGTEADEILKDVMEAQDEFLGKSILVDCLAQEGGEDMVDYDDDAADDTDDDVDDTTDDATDDTTDDDTAADDTTDDDTATDDTAADDTVADDAADDDVPDPRDGTSDTADTAEDIPDTIGDVLDEQGDTNEDVAILLDITGSMWDDQEAVSENIGSIIDGVKAQSGRIAFAWYKDNYYCDDPWYGVNVSMLVDSTDTAGAQEISDFVASLSVGGGCDWPESVYDSVYKLADELNWQSSTVRLIIIITDAPALEPPNSTYSKEDMQAKLVEKGVTLNTITVGISY